MSSVTRRVMLGVSVGFGVLIALGVGCQRATEPPTEAGVKEIAQRALAKIDGELSVKGFKAPVDVLRDRWGIPHIYAQNDDDLFFAQGYVTAQDRLWQMEMWRRWHEGQLAEVFGPAAVPYDERTRLMMFRGPWDAAEWTSYHPDAERLFTAFANGVNAFVEQNRDNLPVEFQMTGVRPGVWTAKTVVLRWTSLSFPSSRGHSVSEAQLAQNVARLGVAEANKRETPDPWDDLKVPRGLDVTLFTPELLTQMRRGDGDPFLPDVLRSMELLPAFRHVTRQALFIPPVQPVEEGSNNWVMSGKLSPTGMPIVANDPHRRIEMPALRYFVHLNAPGWNISGGGEPPFAGVDAGHNEHMAWGFTFAGTDMHDLYVEELHPDHPDQVKWRDGWEPLQILREEIVVKGEATPRTFQMKFSRHGPIVFEDTAKRRAYAVRSIVHEPGTAAYKGSFRLAQATSCEDFFDRAMGWKVPSHSLICGDRKRNIALQVSGLTPDRNGWNGRLPVPGTGEYEWRGFRSDLPREYNPSRGYIATANNNVHPKDYKGRPVFYHSSRGVDVSRIARLHELLGGGRQLSVADHQRIQLDAYSLRARKEQPYFSGWTAEQPETERARQMIATWDGVLTGDSAPAAIYVSWTRVVDSAVQQPSTPPDQRRKLVEAGLRKAIEMLGAEFGPDWASWRYGRLHQSALPHMLAPEFSLPTVERSGGFNSVNAAGANFRRILDVSDWDKSVGTNAPGQSAQPGSPFYDNLVSYWAEGEYFPLVFSREAVDQYTTHRLKLVP